VIRESLILAGREAKKWFGRRAVSILSVITPLMWIALFGKSFNLGGLIGVDVDIPGVPPAIAEAIRAALQSRIESIFGTLDYFTYVTSGMIVVFTLFQSSFGAVGTVFDKRLGYMTRLLVAPISRASIYAAKLLGTLLRITVLSILLIAVAIPMGFQFKEGISPLDLVAAWLIILLLASGFSSIFLAIAFKAENQEVIFATANLVNLPLMFTSSAIFPVKQMPTWLQEVARVNPITYAADLVRYHLIGYSLESYTGELAYLAALASLLLLAGFLLSMRGLEEM